MKIVFTGGVTGGHFYPIISIVEDIHTVVKENKLIEPKIYFMAPTPYNKGVLYNHNITYKRVFAGKIRNYGSILNVLDLFKTGIGIIKAIWTMFWIYPDVVVGKGGYGSFPALVAARILGIPVLIHESDSKPGRVNSWAGKFAKRIAVSYPEAKKYFPENKVAVTGNPVRSQVRIPATDGAHEFLELDENIQTIFILGGSQGSKNINDAILDSLAPLLSQFQLIHQTGKKHFKEVSETAKVILGNSGYNKRYKPFDYMNDLSIRMSAGAADLIITRAGSTLFEVAAWGKPSIVIPISEEVSHDQRKNAFSYSRSGAATVIEENNLSTEILLGEIIRILGNKDIYNQMKESAEKFAKPNASKRIAEEILEMVISHEK